MKSRSSGNISHPTTCLSACVKEDVMLLPLKKQQLYPSTESLCSWCVSYIPYERWLARKYLASKL